MTWLKPPKVQWKASKIPWANNPSKTSLASPVPLITRGAFFVLGGSRRDKNGMKSEKVELIISIPTTQP